MKKILFALFTLLTLNVFAMPLDSIGVKTLNGKQYIMHKVAKGEGVYGISKKYGVSASDVFASNEGSEKSIKIDQVLLIPRKGGSASLPASTGNASVSTKKTEKKYHVVAAGQTLSTIAKKYDVSIAEIKKLNNLKSDNIQLGQKLIVGETVTTTAQTTVKKDEKPAEKVEETPEIAVEEVKKVEKGVKKEEVAPTDNNVVVEADKNSNKPSAIITKTYTVDDGDEISESGMAVISNEGELNQDRSFILHPSAKIGTIIMITNPENNNAVFARVVGSCKAGNGTILKMSKTVADKLGLKEDSTVKINYAR